MAPPSLLTLSNDVQEIVANKVADLLAPRVAVALASACRGLRVSTAAAVAELRRRREAAKAVCRKEICGRSMLDRLRAFRQLSWTGKNNLEVRSIPPFARGLTVADCAALADIIKSTGLPRLEGLQLSHHGFGAAGMRELGEGLGGGALPSLQNLRIDANGIGDAGASALGAALGRGALPRIRELHMGANGIGDAGASALGTALGGGALRCLQELHLEENCIGSSGIIALAPGLRAHAQLEKLNLKNNQIGDDGVTALLLPSATVPLAVPALRVHELDLDNNHVSDASRSTFVQAIRGGAMPSIEIVRLSGNPASVATVEEVRESVRAFRQQLPA